MNRQSRTGILPVSPSHRLEARATAFMNNPGYPTGGAPPALPSPALAAGQTDGHSYVPGEVVAAAWQETETGVPTALGPDPWSPPGIPRPWPQDEYLRDGGDGRLPTTVASDWEVHGLEVEDTVAHFDTLEGRTIVQPSNRVHVYSPRFGAVRQVVSLRQNEQTDRWSGVHLPTSVVRSDEVVPVGTSTQNVQAGLQLGAKQAGIYRTRQGDGALSSFVGPRSFQDAFLPFENLSIIRYGTFEMAEMAFLAEGVNAAVVWSHKQAVQVVLDHQAATEEVGDQKVYSVFTVNQPPPRPKLRVIKVASTQFANPGETIDFTLRFDNVGNQVIGNVTLIDNLTTRLEYVPDSAQCSLPATFRTEPNEAQSLVLRWEITDPVPAGEGGVIRFRCRVR